MLIFATLQLITKDLWLILTLLFSGEKVFKEFPSPFGYRDRAILNETGCTNEKLYYNIGIQFNFTWMYYERHFSLIWNPKDSTLMTFLHHIGVFLREQ